VADESEEASQMSGHLPVGGSVKYSTPWMVSLDVKCRYALAIQLKIRLGGRRVKFSASRLAAALEVPSSGIL